MDYSDDSMIGGVKTVKSSSTASSPQVTDDLIDVVLNNRYLIERKLGQGGFGSIYLASDRKIVARKIVVKVMRTEELANDWSKKKFQQELEALARIDHPSVVGVLDSGETPDGRPFIVMQYIDGVSLRSLLSPEGMQFSRVANVVRQIGKALTAAHQAGILHRDLKPENIMVQTTDDEEHVKIIDFGVAKVRNSIVDVTTAKDVAVGTIAYMSPEQLSAQAITIESDVYAMGVIAYEMLTGKRPTNPESAFQLLGTQRSGIRVKPTDLRPGMPPQAESVLLKALSFSPQDRYERARDFGELLSRALLYEEENTLPAATQKAVNVPIIPQESSLKTRSVPLAKSRLKYLMPTAAVLIVIVAADLYYRYIKTHQLIPIDNTTASNKSATATSGPERALTYWLTYQKMRAGKPDGGILESAGDNIFGNGWRFQFNLTPNEPGALYLINVGPGKDQSEEYNILFPLPVSGQSKPELNANQIFKSEWARFVDRTGVEKLWIVWSTKPIGELDQIFTHAATKGKDAGVISDTGEIEKIKTYLNLSEPQNQKLSVNKETKRTSLQGRGEILVSLLELNHEAY